MSKVIQLRAAVAPRRFALPQHLNLMSSDADNRAGSARLIIVERSPAASSATRVLRAYGKEE